MLRFSNYGYNSPVSSNSNDRSRMHTAHHGTTMNSNDFDKRRAKIEAAHPGLLDQVAAKRARQHLRDVSRAGGNEMVKAIAAAGTTMSGKTRANLTGEQPGWATPTGRRFGGYAYFPGKKGVGSSLELTLSSRRDSNFYHSTLGTAGHEVVHGAADAVFNNSCNPWYASGDTFEKAWEMTGARNLSESYQQQLPTNYRRVYSSYKPSDYDAELLVRHFQNTLDPVFFSSDLAWEKSSPIGAAIVDFFDSTFMPEVVSFNRLRLGSM